MNISERNWLVRLAFLGEELPGQPMYDFQSHGWTTRPRTLTLCALFWRCVLRVMGFLMFGILAYVLIHDAILPNIRGLFLFIVFVICVSPLMVAIAVLFQGIDDVVTKSRESDRMIATTIWGLKHKVCPAIHVKEQP